MRPIRLAAGAAVALCLLLLAGCSGSGSSASATTSSSVAPTTTISSDPCRAGYQAAAARLNSVARNFAVAAQNGQMNDQFAGFAANYREAMTTFNTTVSALPCSGTVKEDIAQLVAAQTRLEPLVAQFAAGQRPPVAEFNAATSAVADAVKRLNAALGIG